jgi:hypothetical protein
MQIAPPTTRQEGTMNREMRGLLPAVLTACLWAGACRADVIFDSYPKITGGGYAVSGPQCFLTENHDYDEAVRFVVPANSDYTMDHVRVALDWVWGNSRAISLCLMSDVAADTVPGEVLACAQPVAIGTTDPIDVDIVIPDCPVLRAGTYYWIAYSVAGDNYCGLPFSGVIHGRHSNRLDGGPWRYYAVTDIPALQVHANPSLTAVGDGPVAGSVLALRAAPNPFNPRTTIRFDLPTAVQVRLAIYDLAGRLVRVLVEGEVAVGSHEAVWDGRDASGRSAPSGSYLARLVAGGKVEGVRLSLVR